MKKNKDSLNIISSISTVVSEFKSAEPIYSPLRIASIAKITSCTLIMESQFKSPR